jgi:hypothetical protein
VNMADYSTEQLLKAAREDAFHGVMMITALDVRHPLRTELKGQFERILDTIDKADWK